MDKMQFARIKKQVEVEAIKGIIDAERGRDFYFSGESHNFWELVYVAGGRAGVTADERMYTLEPGDIILHKPMEFHKIWSVDDTFLHVYLLSFKANGEGMKLLEGKTFKGNMNIRELAEEIMAAAKDAFVMGEYAVEEVCDAYQAQRYINLLELLLLKLSDTKEADVETGDNSKMFSQIIKILNDNIYSKITVDYVAEQCYVSTAKLKKIFNKYTGMGVMTYFNKLKVKKVMELLDQGLSVNEISEALSYSSRFYLSKVFKKETGMTPAKYRNRG